MLGDLWHSDLDLISCTFGLALQAGSGSEEDDDEVCIMFHFLFDTLCSQ